ncbi:PIG-L family deacetylase [Cecembia calidifontis]|jgi:LmbE family N-acetylglucosaminyl deacetylase|uniref:LmbE family N-acetylglucosaminyl deacetylase n=1 Tax=Cecembia calidifontis TaxID=1187080 RepID=A0A4Q7PBL3_9BACT|nr:PIG-L family deacetylase [Cecembia calidifontis]RZS97088.1 LmbE family N-acetylglucosaminyl deacetylase [Cecembia calidifontis]
MRNPKWWLFSFVYFISILSFAQTTPSSVIYHDLLRFKETKRVLYVAAHPDDENTRLIAYLANAEHADVAYLSLTRGDGGQNLIGKELGIELGLIRTHELLRARETDGGRQFFSRALDFGFSKNPDETFNNWDREKLLSDVVWIVRNFQPDIIINRFNTIPGTTHGHHTSSAMLSVEAFTKAADPKVFPEQLTDTHTWQAKRIFWNAYSWGGQYEPEEGKVYHRFLVGEFNPLLGTTYSQIAADSRTMHKSQGFGSTSQIGQGNDFIEMIQGEPFKSSPFEGIESRWNLLKNGAAIKQVIDKAINEFNFIEPEKNVTNLLEIKKLLGAEGLSDRWFLEKKAHLDQMILNVLGVKSEFVIRKEIGYPGEKINVEMIFNNPSAFPLTLQSFKSDLFSHELDASALNNRPVGKTFDIQIPLDYPVSQPFWLQEPKENSLFGIKDRKKIGPPINGSTIQGTVHLLADGQALSFVLPLKYKYNDQVDGEINQPFTLVPEVNVSLDKSNLFIIPGADDLLKVEVTFRNNLLDGEIEVNGILPNQYQIIDASVDERRKRKDYFIKFLDSDQEKKEVTISYLTKDGREFHQDTKRIIYKHIPNLTYFTNTSINLVKMDIKISGQTVGYIPGAGDDVPEVLRSLGYQVSILDDADIRKNRLKDFATVIVGIRAFNVNQALATHVDELMEYVKDGGNLIVQYNTSSPLLTRDLGPYPFNISRDRVTVENSPVNADFSHPILRRPNRVTASDFEGWVQERGLYFTSNWDPLYSTPLTMQDPGESATQGALLHARYGKGTYTYSGISWFRQLPAGVPGAIKIFVNLIEQGSER